jgi:selenide,water dikinase
VSQQDLTRLLQTAGLLPLGASCSGDIGYDAVVRIVNEQVAVVENLDVFTPIHDDPYTQGQIVACNATNDVHVMGVTDILSLQAFLAYPKELPEEVVAGVLKGMNGFMTAIGSQVTGGQTIRNPWPVFGGVCLGIARPEEIVYPSGARVGDAVVLTKPLGTQPAMRSYRDLNSPKRDALLERFVESDLRRIQDNAVRVMTKSALEVARVMRAIGVNAATDVTGFGLIGHASNIATFSGVDIVVKSVPVIRGTLELAEFFGHKLSKGLGAETAGGLLCFMHPEKVDKFSAMLQRLGLPCWTIGETTKPKAKPAARLAPDVEFIETEFP